MSSEEGYVNQEGNAPSDGAEVQTSTDPSTVVQRPQVVNSGKLFVGQVPAVCTEQLLLPLFQPYGTILEIKIMRDQQGRSKGCAWVRYETQSMAQQAIDALHEKHTIPPQTNALRVQFALQRQPHASAPVTTGGNAAMQVSESYRMQAPPHYLANGMYGMPMPYGYPFFPPQPYGLGNSYGYQRQPRQHHHHHNRRNDVDEKPPQPMGEAAEQGKGSLGDKDQ